MNATNPDLAAFKAGGRKLLLWHGWSDPALSALATIGYYQQVEARDPAVRDYFRMFMLPGVLHCGGGPGPDTVEPATFSPDRFVVIGDLLLWRSGTRCGEDECCDEEQSAHDCPPISWLASTPPPSSCRAPKSSQTGA